MNEGYIEITNGLWYEEATGEPWTSRKFFGRGNGCVSTSKNQVSRR